MPNVGSTQLAELQPSTVKSYWLKIKGNTSANQCTMKFNDHWHGSQEISTSSRTLLKRPNSFPASEHLSLSVNSHSFGWLRKKYPQPIWSSLHQAQLELKDRNDSLMNKLHQISKAGRGRRGEFNPGRAQHARDRGNEVSLKERLETGTWDCGERRA